MKHRKFSSPQIGEATFRGKKTPYSFEVYPLNIEFNEVPAVFVISRRKIDKYGRAHHAIVHVGQTESLAAEVKSHKKGRYLKQYQANAVSVLLADSEKSRAAIEADLKSACALRWHRTLENKNLPALPRKQRISTEFVKEEEKAELETSKVKPIAKPKSAERNKVSKTKISEKIEKPKAESLLIKHLGSEITKPKKPVENLEKKDKKGKAESPKNSKKILSPKVEIKAKKTVKDLKSKSVEETIAPKIKNAATLRKTNSAKIGRTVEREKVLISTAVKTANAKKAAAKPSVKASAKPGKKIQALQPKTINKPINQKAEISVKPKKRIADQKSQAVEKANNQKVKTISKKAAQPRKAANKTSIKPQPNKTQRISLKPKDRRTIKTSAKVKISEKALAKVSPKILKSKKVVTAKPKIKTKIEKNTKASNSKPAVAKTKKVSAKPQTSRAAAAAATSKGKTANANSKSRHLKTTSRKRLAF